MVTVYLSYGIIYFYGVICEINFVNMQHNYVDIILIYVNM